MVDLVNRTFRENMFDKLTLFSIVLVLIGVLKMYFVWLIGHILKHHNKWIWLHEAKLKLNLPSCLPDQWFPRRTRSSRCPCTWGGLSSACPTGRRRRWWWWARARVSRPSGGSFRSGHGRSRKVSKDHMIFDLIDLFDQKPFRLVQSNHCLTIDYNFSCKNCLISWI